MGAFRFMGLFTMIPATMFLMVSFFVLFAVGKVEKEGLKKFAQVIAVLLWICSALVFSTGLLILATGRCPIMPPMMCHQMRCEGMCGDIEDDDKDMNKWKMGMEKKGEGKCEQMHKKMMEEMQKKSK